MSDTYGHRKPRAKLLKLTDKYTGWVGESATAHTGRKFVKRYQRRHNRHVMNKYTEQDT